MKALDCTPTWEGVLPIYLECIRKGEGAGYEAALSELRAMAQHADKYNEYLKSVACQES